jgi:hypothetical protein
MARVLIKGEMVLKCKWPSCMQVLNNAALIRKLADFLPDNREGLNQLTLLQLRVLTGFSSADMFRKCAPLDTYCILACPIWRSPRKALSTGTAADFREPQHSMEFHA